MQSARPALSEELDREREAFQRVRHYSAGARRDHGEDGIGRLAPRAVDGLPKLEDAAGRVASDLVGCEAVLADRLQEFERFAKKVDREVAAFEAMDLSASLAEMQEEFESRNEAYYDSGRRSTT